MSVSDFDYFKNRAAAEAERARAAALPEVAYVHARLSEAYLNKLQTLQVARTQTGR